jgi:Xaa-Pro aminopeptidase
MVDEEMRDYIVRGLGTAGFQTVGLSPDAALVRQIKSPAEIALLRAVNTGTATLIRTLRPCLVPGLTEDEVHDIIYAAFRSIGFQPFFALVMFDEDAALPHGGSAIGNKQLTCNTLVVADVGAHYLSYSSDTTRTFLIDCPDSHYDDELAADKEAVWLLVQTAQTTATRQLVKSNTAANVDIAARTVIEGAGYGEAFTHRVGHGIGIKAHESPYLNKWSDAVLQPGMAFTLEPGVYLEGKFGVRHEDVFVVSETDEPLLMTSRRARGLRNP